jgi:hypothetical protein
MRPSEGRISLWPVAVIGCAVIFAALSITPTVKLKAVPPPDFVVLPMRPDAARAEQYWQVAVRVTQWKHNRTAKLPEQAPPDFRLADVTGHPANYKDRAAYWAKLREDWPRPENWHTTYTFDAGWPLRNAQDLSREILDFINRT